MQREVGPKVGLYMVQAIRHLMRSISMKTKEKQRFMVGADYKTQFPSPLLFSSLLFFSFPFFSFLPGPECSQLRFLNVELKMSLGGSLMMVVAMSQSWLFPGGDHGRCKCSGELYEWPTLFW